MNEFLEAQQAVISGIVIDLKYPPEDRRQMIAVIVDDIGLSADAFSNTHLRNFYLAASGEYIRNITCGKPMSLDDVLVTLEKSYRYNGHQADAHILLDDWRKKISMKERIDGDPIRSAEILKHYTMREMVKDETGDFLRRLHSSDNPLEEIQDYTAFLTNLGVERGHAITLKATIEEEGKSIAKPETSGYPRLDGKGRDGILAIKGHESGGWLRGRFVTMVGDSGAGKTTVAINLAARRAEMQMPVVYHSFEMDRPTIFRTMICCSALCTANLAFNASATKGPEYEAITDAQELIDKWVRVYDEPTDLEGLQRRMKRHQVEFGSKMVLHIIDHIGAFMESTKQSWQQLQTISRDLKASASENNTCVLALVHPGGPSESLDDVRKNNRASRLDAYGGQAVRQWSDVMFLIARHNGSDGIGGIDQRLRSATIFQGFKNRQGKGSADDTYFVLSFDPVTENLGQKILIDDQAKLFNSRPTYGQYEISD